MDRGSSIAARVGARSRFANIIAGIVMAGVILLFGPAMAGMAIPPMAGLLIVIGFRTFKPERVEMVWKTGPIQQVVMAITFVFYLLIPLQYAVLIGVTMSLLLYVLQQSNKITIKEWKRKDGPYPIEQDAPETLPGDEVVYLVPFGSLFFAAAPIFEQQLPEITGETSNTVVILNLRGHDDLGSIFFNVLERYAADLQKHQSKVMLAGVSTHVIRQLEHTGLMTAIGRDNVFPATEQLGEAGLAAWDAAEKWVANNARDERSAIEQQV